MIGWLVEFYTLCCSCSSSCCGRLGWLGLCFPNLCAVCASFLERICVSFFFPCCCCMRCVVVRSVPKCPDKKQTSRNDPVFGKARHRSWSFTGQTTKIGVSVCSRLFGRLVVPFCLNDSITFVLFAFARWASRVRRPCFCFCCAAFPLVIPSFRIHESRQNMLAIPNEQDDEESNVGRNHNNPKMRKKERSLHWRSRP